MIGWCPGGVAAGSISRPEPARHKNRKLPISSQLGGRPLLAKSRFTLTPRSTSVTRMYACVMTRYKAPAERTLASMGAMTSTAPAANSRAKSTQFSRKYASRSTASSNRTMRSRMNRATTTVCTAVQDAPGHRQRMPEPVLQHQRRHRQQGRQRQLDVQDAQQRLFRHGVPGPAEHRVEPDRRQEPPAVVRGENKARDGPDEQRQVHPVLGEVLSRARGPGEAGDAMARQQGPQDELHHRQRLQGPGGQFVANVDQHEQGRDGCAQRSQQPARPP